MVFSANFLTFLTLVRTWMVLPVFGITRQGYLPLKQKSNPFFYKKLRPSRILHGRFFIIYNLVGGNVTVLPSAMGQVIRTLMYVSMVGPEPIPLRVSFSFLGNVCIVTLGKVVSTFKSSTSPMGNPVSG
jgi:hypothetical protein